MEDEYPGLQQIEESQVPIGEKTQRAMNKPKGTPATLYNGRDVIWTRIVVPADEVKNTVVFGDNDRVQSLLTADSVKDITDSMTEYGPDKSAVGRINEHGEIEVGDGSRRRFASIENSTPFPVDVTDLTNKEMQHLSMTGNIYRKPSVYEQGQRYLNLQESLRLNNSQLVDYLKGKGETVSRRKVSRYINTAKLPLEIIQAFTVANDCSADFGEKLWRSWEVQSSDCSESMEMRAAQIRANSNLSDPKDILKALLGSVEKPAAAEPEILHEHAIAKAMKNGGLSIELSAEVSEKLLVEIKEFIELTLAGE